MTLIENQQDNQRSGLTADQFRAIEGAQLGDINDVDINDVINKYIYNQIAEQPSYVEQYKRYLKQRWDVYDIDFTQDYKDWHENMTEAEKNSFLAIASGFHHGERQVEVELPVFMLGGSEDQKLFISSQIEDEARHTVFFDRFYHEAIGLEGDLMDVLDQSFEWVGETFIGPFGLLAYQADALLKNPDDLKLRVQYATNYMLWIEGVLAVSVMQITLRYARQRKVLPGYYAGFTLTARDEARHVQAGLRFLTEALEEDPTLIREVHDTLRTLLLMSSTSSQYVAYEPIGWTRDDVQAMFITQLVRKMNLIGLELPPDLAGMVQNISADNAIGG